jgi:hypothetical protein
MRKQRKKRRNRAAALAEQVGTDRRHSRLVRRQEAERAARMARLGLSARHDELVADPGSKKCPNCSEGRLDRNPYVCTLRCNIFAGWTSRTPEGEARTSTFKDDNLEGGCASCGGYAGFRSWDDLQVHHLRYTVRGEEPDNVLVLLCPECHEDVHQELERCDIKWLTRRPQHPVSRWRGTGGLAR